MRRGGIGGDWYDAFALGRAGVALVVGDVMGHGIGAAAMMAQMRTGLRAYALDGHSPAASSSGSTGSRSRSAPTR